MKPEKFMELTKTLMLSATGREFMWGLFHRTNLHGASYAGAEAPSAFNEGRRSIGVELYDFMMGDELLRQCYVDMVSENVLVHVDEPDVLPEFVMQSEESDNV